MLAGVVPDAGHDDAVGSGHPRHLGQAGNGVGHEMDDQLGEGGVELVLVERQVLGGGPAHVDAGVSRPRRLDERFRWVDGCHVDGPSRATSSDVSAPGPQPTSSTRWPLRTPAKSTICGASKREYRPM